MLLHKDFRMYFGGFPSVPNALTLRSQVCTKLSSGWGNKSLLAIANGIAEEEQVVAKLPKKTKTSLERCMLPCTVSSCMINVISSLGSKLDSCQYHEQWVSVMERYIRMLAYIDFLTCWL